MESQQKYLRNGYSIIKRLLQNSLEKTINQQNIKLVITTVQNKPKEDYTCPAAVRIFNEYKKEGEAFGFKSAKQMAEKLLENISSEYKEYFDEITMNNAGFLSIKVKESYMEEEINKIIRNGVKLQEEKNEKVLVDFSSPNIAKQMHVGHLRSTIIGESICRILEFKGMDVMRVNHLGDWGTQFGMLIEYIKENVKDISEEKHSLDDVLDFYKASKKCFDSDPEFKLRSQLNVTKLQSYDPYCIQIWQMLTRITMLQNNKLYKRLDISINDFGESYYNKMIPSTVEECQQKNLVKLDEGAQCFFVDGFETPLIVIKKDGGYNYDSTDLAAIRHRIFELQRNRIIYVTDIGQQEHFFKIFKAAEMAGWAQQDKVKLNHVGFGLIQGSDGKKFKSRDGDTVKLEELIDTAVKMASDDLKKREGSQEEGQVTNLKSEEEIKIASENIGISAIKYFDMKQNRVSDYRFEYSKMLDFKGNTAVYLFYSYVRICSIIKKSQLSQEQINELAQNQGFKFTHDHEKLIGQLLVKFAEYIDIAVEELELHKICDFVYALTVKVAEGYSKYRILGEKETNHRILLCYAVKLILEKTFYLLGLKPVESI